MLLSPPFVPWLFLPPPAVFSFFFCEFLGSPVGDLPLLCEASKPGRSMQAGEAPGSASQRSLGGEWMRDRPPPVGVVHVDDLLAGTEVVLASVGSSLKRRQK